jgi:alkylation response protein AidB-like acyl-CoA dehydrogenase
MPPAYPALLDDAERPLVDEIQRFAGEELIDAHVPQRDTSGAFWEDGWRRCASRGLCGLPVPRELGGQGASRVATAAALEALGYRCDDAGLLFALNAHLWSSVVPLWHYGSDEQQRKYLRPLCSGSWVGAHTMTEPGSGSDAFSLSTIAEPDHDEYVITGRKALITNAPRANVFIVFARSPGSEGVIGVSAFLVEANAPGLTIGPPIEKLGLRTAVMSEVSFDHVRVADDSVLGRPGRGARVFGVAMEWERLLITAGQLGALQRSLEEAIAFARDRRQFGVPIAQFQAVSHKLVDARVGIAAARALMYETAWNFDRGATGPAPAAAVKLFAAETAVKLALELLQVHGGWGYTRELPFERRLRDAVGARIYSGTSELMRQVVARSLGL